MASVSEEAWAALPAETRARVIELAKKDRPYPDREVARVAVAWAREVPVDGRQPWWLHSPLAVIAFLVLPAAVWLLHHLTEYRIDLLVFFCAFLGLVALGGLLSRRRETAHAKEVQASNLAWSLTEAVDKPDSDPEFRGSGRGGPDWSRLAFTGVALFLIGNSYFSLWSAVVYAGAVTAFQVLPAYLPGVSASRRRPVVVLSGVGPTFPGYKLSLTWSDVTDVDTSMMDGEPSVCWHLRDGRRRRWLRSGLSPFRNSFLEWRIRSNAGVLAIPWSDLADPPERLILAARCYLRNHVPVGLADSAVQPGEGAQS